MEGDGDSAIADVRIRNGQRLSIFRSYAFPYMDRTKLTVLTHACVTRVTFDGQRATGVESDYQGTVHRLGAGCEVVLSLGAIHTAKALMQSGSGDQAELQRLGIPLVQHLPGVGQDFQDHVAAASCVWEYQQHLDACNNACEATFFGRVIPASAFRICSRFKLSFLWSVPRWRNVIRRLTLGLCSLVLCNPRAEGISV
jgi:choline dehydrogenase